MIEEETTDAYGESEQVTGWLTMIDETLELPFETTVPGIQVTVERVDLNRREQIVAICRRGGVRQSLLSSTCSCPRRRQRVRSGSSRRERAQTPDA